MKLEAKPSSSLEIDLDHSAIAKKHDRAKLLLLSSAFFLAIASFSVLKPLKNSVFLALVGGAYQPYTRFIFILALMPLMALYSRIVDKLRRYQVVCFFAALYAVVNLIFAYYLLHPVYGVANTEASYTRILGWAFHALFDFYPIFIVSTFWAFSNSICSPESAKNNYGIMVAASKVGGIVTPLLSDLALQRWHETAVIPTLVAITSILLVSYIAIIMYLQHSIPGRYLHGYEAAYQLEKKMSKAEAKEPRKRGLEGIVESVKKVFDGIRLMVTQPYVFGIFGILFSFEIISAIVDFQMQMLVSSHYKNMIGDMASFFLRYTAAWQGLGLVFALFGTKALLNRFDVRACLMVSPAVVGIMLASLYVHPHLTTVVIFMVVLRALNYGFNVPIREILYIPTVKAIKFKSKAWTDSFGRAFSKTSGSAVNILSIGNGLSAQIASGSIFSLLVVALWSFIALVVGRTYTRTVKAGDVIGDASDETTT